MLEEYSFLLKSNNTSDSMEKLFQRKIGNQEVILTTICQQSKLPLITPIRHTNLNNINCVFELEYWLEIYQQMYKKVDPNCFSCPGCRKYCTFKDYGVDYNFSHILQELENFKNNNPNIKLNTSQIIYSPSRNTYYVQQKITNKRYQLPGSKPISEATKRIQGLNKESSQFEQTYIVDEISQTLVKLQSFIYNRISRIISQSNNNTLKFQDLQSQVALRKYDLKQVLNDSMKLISLGRQSLNDDYIFALNKKRSHNQIQSILIVYFVYYGVWQEFPLKFKGKPYEQLENALYIKGEGSPTHNHIFIVGGEVERFSQTDQVLQISFPKCVFLNGDEAKITELPKLPKQGYNFMGTFYNQQLFVFYGQRWIQTNENSIRYEPLNSQYVFKSNRWEQMQLQLIERLHGSFFTIKHNVFSKLIVFFGGLQQTTQLHSGQIFICRDEQFLGVTSKEFKISFLDQDPYHRSVLASPVFSCPYYGNKQLLLSGESMKQKNIHQRQIYTFDYENGTLKLNELFSLEPPEHNLTSYRRKNKYNEIFSPVQDSEGIVIYGNFYVIHQYELEQRYLDENPQTVLQLLKINLSNGQFTSIPYLDPTKSKEIAYEQYEKLEDKLNQEII